MTVNRKTALAVGTLAGTLALSGAAFALTPLGSGYMQDAKQDAAANKKDHVEGQCGVASMDKDGDGRLSKQEFADAHDGKTDLFADHDIDGDGFITQAEMDKAHAKMKEARKDDAEGTCGSAPKAGEGKCGEGKCGAGKCGGSL